MLKGGPSPPRLYMQIGFILGSCTCGCQLLVVSALPDTDVSVNNSRGGRGEGSQTLIERLLLSIHQERMSLHSWGMGTGVLGFPCCNGLIWLELPMTGAHPHASMRHQSLQ